jgi:hypothetical protein
MYKVYMELKCATLINNKKHENYKHHIKATNLLPLTAKFNKQKSFYPLD